MGTASISLGISFLVLFAVARLCLCRSLLVPTAEPNETGNGATDPNPAHKAGLDGGASYGAAWGRQNGHGAGDHFWVNFPKGNGRASSGYGDNNSPGGGDTSYNYGWEGDNGFSHHGEWAFRGRGGSYGGGEYMGGGAGGGIWHGGSGDQGSSYSSAGSSAIGNGEGYGYGYGFGGDTHDTSSSRSGGNGGYAP